MLRRKVRSSDGISGASMRTPSPSPSTRRPPISAPVLITMSSLLKGPLKLRHHVIEINMELIMSYCKDCIVNLVYWLRSMWKSDGVVDCYVANLINRWGTVVQSTCSPATDASVTNGSNRRLPQLIIPV